MIDYFATSLPNLRVFDEDLQGRSDSDNHLLIAFAYHGLRDHPNARLQLEKVLDFTNSNQDATNLQRVLILATSPI